MPIIDDTVTGGFRQGEMVVFTGTSHNTFIANAPGIGESKISYVDFLNEWRQVCV